MKNIKKYIAVALAGVMSLSLAGCNILQKTPESIQKTVLATVNDEKITRGDLDLLMKADIEQYKQQYGEDYENNDTFKDTLKTNRTDALTYLVEEKVLLQKAKDLDVVPSDEEIDTYITEQESKYKSYTGTDEAYTTYLASIGYTPDSFKDVLKTQCIVTAVINEIVKDVTATDEEIQTYYDANQDTLKVEAGAYVTHLLIPQTATVTASEDKALALAKKAKELTASGKTFEQIAAMDEFKAASAKYEDLGHKTFENSGLVTEFETAFKALPAGQISDPVKTSYGWHLILNSKVNTAAEVPALKDIKAQVEAAVLNPKKQELYKEKMEEFKTDMKVKTYPEKF